MPSLKSAMTFVTDFGITYAAVIPRIAYRMTLSCLVDPRGARRFVHDVLDATDLGGEDRVLGSLDIQELFPGDEDVTLKAPWQSSSFGGTCRLLELGCLAHVVKSQEPSVIFEIGTFIGRTTRLFGLNTPPQTRIYTLDLPQDRVPHRIGRDFVGTPEAQRIEQLAGDSRTFDYTPWHGRCDFVWVDACHDYEFVVADTASALRLCRPRGWIGWHDYWHSAPWCGVTRCVRETRGWVERIHHLRGTTIVLAQTGGSVSPGLRP